MTTPTPDRYRQLLTVVGLALAAVAVLAPIAMVAAVLGALPDPALGVIFVTWVVSLALIVVITKHLKRRSGPPPGP